MVTPIILFLFLFVSHFFEWSENHLIVILYKLYYQILLLNLINKDFYILSVMEFVLWKLPEGYYKPWLFSEGTRVLNCCVLV